jgi:hypothetical protein
MILCPNYKITYTPRALMFAKDGETAILDGSNFEPFQKTLEDIFCFNIGPMD